MDNRLENLQELIDAIDMGLDIEFSLYGIRYNISTNQTPFIAVCPKGKGEHYEDGDELVNNHFINGKSLAEQWQEIEIYSM